MGGFYFDVSVLYSGQDVKIEVGNGEATVHRQLFANQNYSLPRSSEHEWERKVRGTLLTLNLGQSDGLNYTKPLFLSVLNAVSLPYTILAQEVLPYSGGMLDGCSFTVSIL